MRHLFSLVLVFTLLACSSPPPEVIPVPDNPEHVARGSVLVNGLAACGRCHGERPEPGSQLAGGQVQYDRYGAVIAPNITPSETGIAGWDVRDVIRAIRASEGPDESYLSSEVHRGYEWMSDNDVLAIVGYLATLPAVEKTVERRDIGFIDRNTTGIMESRYDSKGYVPEISKRFKVEYGQYLTDHIARCQSCHNSPESLVDAEVYLAGGKTIQTGAGSKVAPNISSSLAFGIGEWSEPEIVEYLRTGTTPDSHFVDPAFCPIEFYKQASNEDLEAIAAYLKATPPA